MALFMMNDVMCSASFIPMYRSGSFIVVFDQTPNANNVADQGLWTISSLSASSDFRGRQKIMRKILPVHDPLTKDLGLG